MPACCRFALLVLLLLVNATLAAENWPQWRGPRADGHTADAGLPVTWDARQIVWKTSLPGRGQSSPVLWENRIFLTSASQDGRQRQVLCYDRASGKLLWQQQVELKGEPERLHKMNSFASATCVTDGELVIAFFGRAGLHCYSIDGQHLWSRNLGEFETNPWGTAACPVLVGDLVIQNCDNDTNARLEAFHKRTGELAWSTQRPNARGWSTPVLVHAGQRQELLLNGDAGVTGYNPLSGEQLWFCKGYNGRGEPTVTPGKNVVYLVNGKAGDVYAVQPGGSGDVTASRMAWHTPRKSGRDLPSPILIDNYLLVVSMSGILTCYDAASGKVLYTERLGGNFSASPIAAHGLAYFQSEDGPVVVIKPGAALDVVARNTVDASDDEIFRGSPAVYAGQLFLRSDKALYAIGKVKANGG